jgi:alkanesulfonate monooxygenase SsuD/methylene tetrahydromethanopterin reductase-like flavin-dependent oxidoreductase (luciferase family)
VAAAWRETEYGGMDYGRPIEFGFSPTPAASDYETTVATVRLADDLGIDLVGIQDHPYQRRFLDTFSLLADLVARTRRIRFFPDVANLPLRPPAVMAKAAASIDHMSGGRFELGLGAGAFWEAVEAMGGTRRGPGEAVEALTEAIEVIRLMWSGERGLRFDGRHYRLNGVHSGPVPAHEIGIWIGAGGPRLLRLIGRVADGWVPSSSWAPPERLAKLNQRIDEGARPAGREPSAIRRIYNVSGKITEGGRGEFLEGPVSYWIEELTKLAVGYGIDAFIYWPAVEVGTQLRRLAEEVAPAVREAVAKNRKT